MEKKKPGSRKTKCHTYKTEGDKAKKHLGYQKNMNTRRNTNIIIKGNKITNLSHNPRTMRIRPLTVFIV